MKQQPPQFARKTIQFLLPGAGIAGGIKVVFQYAEYLQKRGHTVRLYYPGVMEPQGALWPITARLRQLKYWLMPTHEAQSWFPLTVPIYHVPSLEAAYIPPADITIATGNRTADWAAQLPKNRGTLFYFLQDWEAWDRTDADLAENWRLPLKKITISSSLQKIADTLKVPIEAVVVNGVDHSAFYVENRADHAGVSEILMMSHHDERKGIPDGLKALDRIHTAHPDIRITSFGSGARRDDMPTYITYHQAPSLSVLRHLYNSADIFLSPSWAEGFGLPAMEAMACGCAVVATNVGGIPDYTIAGKTALVVEPHHPELLFEACEKLISDPKLLASIKSAGHNHVAQFTSEKAAAEFEAAILGSARA